jgi:cellulose synthase/poly-beta-1,6-N-acetylglucosamine synthase-like glycosyltransferase
MLSQNKKLHTIFVSEAISETIAPQSLQHYLSQRRRWGSNAYFNNYFYWMGDNVRNLRSSVMKDQADLENLR